jgi:hypothetical protein
LLTAPPPNGIGFGPIYSDYQVLQIAPAVAYQVTDRVAAGPTVDLATLRVDPGFFAAPDNANGDAAPTYPRGLTAGRSGEAGSASAPTTGRTPGQLGRP